MIHINTHTHAYMYIYLSDLLKYAVIYHTKKNLIYCYQFIKLPEFKM